MNDTQKRLRRLQGQLASVEAAVSADAPCAEVVPQLLASKGALDATVRTYLETAMNDCLAGEDPASLKQVINMFIKHVT